MNEWINEWIVIVIVYLYCALLSKERYWSSYNKGLNELMNEWMNECMNEWMNEWIDNVSLCCAHLYQTSETPIYVFFVWQCSSSMDLDLLTLHRWWKRSEWWTTICSDLWSSIQDLFSKHIVYQKCFKKRLELLYKVTNFPLKHPYTYFKFRPKY